MSESTHGGKGDRQRTVDREKFEANWNAIFGKKKLPTEKVDSGFKSSKKGDSN